MVSPDPRSPRTSFAIVGRVLAGVVAAAAGSVLVLAAWLALSSRFGFGAADPHGYGLLFGTVLALLAGLLTAVLLPFAFPRRLRGRVFRVGHACFGILLVLLVVSLVTA